MAGVVYYVYVVGRFYRKEIISFLRGKRGAGQAPGKPVRPGAGKAGLPLAGPGGDVVPDPRQPKLFQGTEEGAGAAPELFKVMEKVVGVLKSVVAQAVAGGTEKEELLDHIQEVLAGYGHLRGTPYQESINRFLMKTCSSNFSLVLGDMDLVDLWG